jgi:hypothetical protein
MIATQGRIVLYVLSANDADAINRRRTTGAEIAKRMGMDVWGDKNGEPIHGWPAGAQAHIGNPASELDTYPMMIVRVWPDEFGPGVPGVNGQVFLDGNDVLWVTSVREGTEPGTWYWPARLPEAKTDVPPTAAL